MQILNVSADHYASNRKHLNQMHRLRAAVFGSRLQWDVTITEQGERDRYDDLLPTYILAISADQRRLRAAASRVWHDDARANLPNCWSGDRSMLSRE